MTTNVSDFICVSERAAGLGCADPVDVTILPINFETARDRTEFLMRAEAATVKTLFRKSSVPLNELLPAGERSAYVQNNNFEWILPTLFFSGTFISGNIDVISIGMNVLSNYITDFLKGVTVGHSVKIDIIVEKKGRKTCKKITYQGDASGIAALSEIIRQVSDE